MKQQDKKQSYKPKFQDKQKPVSKFNFVFDQDKITYKTQIPELPTKLKPKPNEQAHLKKTNEVRQKINILKQKRKEKKQEYKKGSQNFDEQISNFKSKIELAKKCLVVLNHDLQDINQSQNEIGQKIEKKTKLLKNLQRGPRQNKQQKKKYQQMTYQQLEAEQQRLSVRVSTAILTKKQETQINAILAKLARIKKNAPHGQKPKDNTTQIQATQQSLQRLKNVKQNLQNQQSQVRHKIERIQEDIDQFKDQIEQLEENKKNPENEALYQQSKELKNQIYNLREEIKKLQSQFQTRKTEYQYQQAKIQWIKWATQIKNKINQEWEAEKQQRRRQKLREKNKQKKTEQGKTGQKQATVQQGEKKPQRKKFNKHQQQIDTCTFLISYCQGLVKKEEPEKKNQELIQNKNIEDVLKTGEWSKVKDAQVIKSKKSNLDDQKNDKNEKPKKKKTIKQKQNQNNAEQKPKAFSHQFFTLHAFDSVKVVPPTKEQEVQAIIKQLNEKLNYYLQHPEGGLTQQKQKFEPKQQRSKNIGNQKYGKSKYATRQKKVINTQEFPNLN